jgi:hypothetical protein
MRVIFHSKAETGGSLCFGPIRLRILVGAIKAELRRPSEKQKSEIEWVEGVLNYFLLYLRALCKSQAIIPGISNSDTHHYNDLHTHSHVRVRS